MNKILLIENNEEHAHLLQDILGNKGYAVSIKLTIEYIEYQINHYDLFLLM